MESVDGALSHSSGNVAASIGAAMGFLRCVPTRGTGVVHGGLSVPYLAADKGWVGEKGLDSTCPLGTVGPPSLADPRAHPGKLATMVLFRYHVPLSVSCDQHRYLESFPFQGRADTDL